MTTGGLIVLTVDAVVAGAVFFTLVYFTLDVVSWKRISSASFVKSAFFFICVLTAGIASGAIELSVSIGVRAILKLLLKDTADQYLYLVAVFLAFEIWGQISYLAHRRNLEEQSVLLTRHPAPLPANGRPKRRGPVKALFSRLDSIMASSDSAANHENLTLADAHYLLARKLEERFGSDAAIVLAETYAARAQRDRDFSEEEFEAARQDLNEVALSSGDVRQVMESILVHRGAYFLTERHIAAIISKANPAG